MKDQNESWGRFLLETAILLVIVFMVRFYVFQLFRISGPSMCPTLNFLNNQCEFEKGEFVFVDQISLLLREPERGEIAVFNPPNSEKYYIKRVLGVPGDTIEFKQGKAYLSNDEVTDYPLAETYLSERNQGNTKTYGVNKFVVPEGKYFLVGDNRSHSLDGRQCFSGIHACSGQNKKNAFIESSDIKGVARFVIWPFWTVRKLENEYTD